MPAQQPASEDSAAKAAGRGASIRRSRRLGPSDQAPAGIGSRPDPLPEGEEIVGQPKRGFLLLALIPIILAVLATPLIRRLQDRDAAPAPSQAAQTVSYTVCLEDPSWAPPDRAAEQTYLDAQPRYRGLSSSQLPPLRIYVESGQTRSATSFDDWVVLSGLWSAPADVRAEPCDPRLNGRIEVWLLGYAMNDVQLAGSTILVRLTPESRGVQVAHIDRPRAGATLRFTDLSGRTLIEDQALAAFQPPTS